MQYFFDLSPQARATEAKISKWDLIKLKSFCSEGNHQRQPTEWEKIFANSKSDEDIKEFIQLNNKTPPFPIKKCPWGTSPALQWLKLYASTALGMGLIPGWELRSCMPYSTAKEKKKKKTYILED